ncbi:MAG: isoaspartyl peptidase/L-asparaginase [Bacteroidales bacterium]|nr:isoaspartyl peptidase/L-asparaginase [Bacteroidales bacterium]
MNWLQNFIYTLIIFITASCTQENKEIRNVIKHPVLVIHGGAGTILKESMSPDLENQYREKLIEALEVGYDTLLKGGKSVDAVVLTIQVLENSPLFNAGIGAVFTHDGKNELDASIMDGSTGIAGAVAGVSTIKSPIEAAYSVMTESEHVLLSGKGAEEFAKKKGLEIVDPKYFYTEKRHEQLKRMLNSEKEQADSKFGTVGAVALDIYGNLAAGTSTGGMTNKRYGRIGDSPLIGAGTYADNNTCAVSATGHGEYFIRNLVAYDIAARMKYQQKKLESSATEVIKELKLKGGSGGVICLDTNGNISTPFNTTGMYRGYIQAADSAKVFIYANNYEK